MLRRALIVVCVLGGFPVLSSAEWNLAPRIAPGTELVFRGSVTETSSDKGVRFHRRYQMELRTFSLEEKTDGYEIAFLTKLWNHDQPGGKRPGDAAPNATDLASLRLDVAHLRELGALSTRRKTVPSTPLDGPATWELGAFLEVPKGSVGTDRSWQLTAVPGQPVRRAAVLGTEAVGATLCVKVQVEQVSDDWHQPRADRTAWKRVDVLWLDTRLGVAQRVERTIQRRAPAHNEATYQLTTEYSLESQMRFEGTFYERRKREIQEAVVLHDLLHEYFADPKRATSKAFEAVAVRIDQVTEKSPPTPFRDYLTKLKTQALAAAKGQIPPAILEDGFEERLAVGKQAPEFTVEDLLTGKQTGLAAVRGKPLLMVFFQPNSKVAPEMLRRLRLMGAANDGIQLVGVSMTDDREATRRLCERVSWVSPTLSGRSLRHCYAVDATPRIVVVNREGVVLGAYTGWGPEIQKTLVEDLQKARK